MVERIKGEAVTGLRPLRIVSFSIYKNFSADLMSVVSKVKADHQEERGTRGGSRELVLTRASKD